MQSYLYKKNQLRITCATFILVITHTITLTPLKAEPLINEQELSIAKALFSGPSEEDYYRTDEMLISATGSLKPVFLAPSVASVITKERIEAMGATTLDEVLETVPGLHVMPSLLLGPYLNNYSIRGVSTNFNPQTLLLINGIPQSSLWSGGNDYRFVLPVETISRIEIVRGPGSAIYGADAFSGTINIIIKDGQEVDGAQAGIRAGSFDTYDVWAQYGKNISGWDTFASFETRSNGTDQNRIIDSDLQTILDGVFGTTASLAPGPINDNRKHYNYHLALRKNNWTARIIGLKMWDAGIGVGIAPVLDPTSKHSSERYVTDLLYENADLHPDWEVSLRTSYTYLNNENNYIIFPAGSSLPIGSDGNAFTDTVGVVSFPNGFIGNPNETNKIIAFEAAAFYSGIKQHKLRISTGFTQAKFEASETKNFGPSVIDGTQNVVNGTLSDVSGGRFIYGPNKNRRLLFTSIQDEWAIARTLELTAGIRYDDYSDFGSTTNPRAALVWQTRYDLSTKLLYGRAFRAPAFSELYAQNNPVILGNPDLKPEVIDTIEFAVDYRPTVDLVLNANAFYYEIDGLIEVVPNANAVTKTAQNIRDQKARGAEFEFSWKANSRLQFSGNSAWIKAVDQETNLIIPNVPRAQAYGNIHWVFLPKFSIDTQWFWVGYHARALGDDRDPINNYHLMNLTLRKKDVVKKFDVAFAVRNALDANIRSPSTPTIPNDIPMNGRNFWFEVRAKF